MTEASPHESAPLLSGKAVTYNGRGGYDSIQIAERQVRAPGDGEVRIRVKAAAINPADLAMRDAVSDQLSYPLVPGMDAAGIVESVGAGVSRLHVGQEVMTAVMPLRPDGGAQATYIVVPEASAAPIPRDVSLIEAATLPMNGLTALLALDLSGLKAGETLAVTGGAGLLAHYAIAAAKRQGLKVIADAKPEEADLVRGYGADIIVPRSDDFAGAVRKEVPGGVDALLDTAVLGETSFPAIRDGGVYLPVRHVEASDKTRIQIKPVWVHHALERTEWVDLLRQYVEVGAIKLRVTGEYQPEQVADAHRALSAGGLRGRPVILF